MTAIATPTKTVIPIHKKLRSVVSAFLGYVNAFIPDYSNDAKGIHLYGKMDNIPNDLLKAIANSGVATRAMGKLAEYIASDGFADKDASAVMVNDSQTADDLLQEQATYCASLYSMAFHIQRKGAEVWKVKALPVQCVRKKKDGSFIFNPTYGQPKLDRAQEKVYPAFKGPKLEAALIGRDIYAGGEILYVYRKSPFNSYYPVPDYYNGIEDVRTSAELSKMDLELTVNGFFPSSIITVVGDINDTQKDDDGKTEKDHYVDDFREFTGRSSQNADGTRSRFKAMLQFAATKDEVTNIQTLDIKAIIDSSNEKRDLISREVSRLWGVHPCLLGYSDAAVLGNTQALANAAVELNKVANPFQRMIAKSFKLIWPDRDWTVSEYMPIQYIPTELLQDMTQDERRNKFLGLKPLKTTEPTNA